MGNTYLKHQSKSDMLKAEAIYREIEAKQIEAKHTRFGSKRNIQIADEIKALNESRPELGFDEKEACALIESVIQSIVEIADHRRHEFADKILAGEYTLRGSDAIAWRSDELIQSELNAQWALLVSAYANEYIARGESVPVEAYARAKNELMESIKSSLLRNEWTGNSSSIFHNAVDSARRNAAADFIRNNSISGLGMIDRILKTKEKFPAWTGWTPEDEAVKA